MPFIEREGARIHWEVEGEGTPVLLIMGHLYSSRMWYPLLPALTKNHRVITFDNRGTGQSDTTHNVSVEQMTADAAAVLDAAGESSAHVYGVSMGGGIAGEFAMAYPERTRSVTLGCTLLKTPDMQRHGSRAKWVYYMPLPFVRWMMRTFAKPEAYGSAAPIDAVRKDMAVLASDRFTMRGVREQSQAIERYSSTRERAREKATMPVLVLHGDEDAVVDVKHGRELAEILPHAELQIFHGAGHNYLVASGGRANDVFIDFIERVDAQRAAA